MFPANCGVATVIRATQVSPLRLAAASCGVASVIRAVMDVGAPFMTPGAGTAQPVRGIARCGVRDVSGQLRRCDGYPGDTSVAPTFGGGIPRRCDGCSRGVSGQLRRCDGFSGDTNVAPTFWRRHSAALRRPAGGDGRRGAIYDARCRNGTTRPRRCSRRCTRCFRPIAGDTSVALRWAACVAVTLSADALKLSAGLFFLSQ